MRRSLPLHPTGRPHGRRSPSPIRLGGTPTPAEEAELVARAKALLADYEPQAPKPRPSNFEYGQLVTARRRRADAARGARAIGR